MGYVLPEWEMEWILVNNPHLLSPDPEISRFEVIAQQYHLPHSGGYIDILCSFPAGLIVVELKNEFVDDTYVLTHQLHKYQTELAHVFDPSGEVRCLLVSTHGFSRQVQDLAHACSVRLQTIPVEHLLEQAWRHQLTVDAVMSTKARLLQRRVGLESLDEAMGIVKGEHEEKYRQDLASIDYFTETRRHDAHALRQLGRVLWEMSRRSPIMAHRVFDAYDEDTLEGDDQKWFWFFYSVLDRRANAATFVKAKEALQTYGLFRPQEIARLVENTSYEEALERVFQILRDNHFPLVADSVRRDLAMPSSIVDAALYLSRFSFSIDEIPKLCDALTPPCEDLAETIMFDLRKHIYGVGPRIAAQIVRGFCLKGGWDLSLSATVQLERCPFNETFAGPARLGLVLSSESYLQDLKLFAKLYLNDNCGVLSHALWFIRKRFCLRPKRCDACPVAGFCNHFCSQLSFPARLRPISQLTLFPSQGAVRRLQ